jgi:hypothetical protein
MSFVIGLSLDRVELEFHGTWYTTAAGMWSFLGIDLDGTSTNDADVTTTTTSTITGYAGYTCDAKSIYKGFPGIGYHYLQLIEYAGAPASTYPTTFYGTSSPLKSGAVGVIVN